MNRFLQINVNVKGRFRGSFVVDSAGVIQVRSFIRGVTRNAFKHDNTHCMDNETNSQDHGKEALGKHDE
jgi:hypothetical protein